MEILSSIEQIVAIAVLLIGVGITYHKIIARIETNKKMIDQRVDFIQEQIDNIEKKNEDSTKVLFEIRVQLSSMRTDIEHILKAIEKFK